MVLGNCGGKRSIFFQFKQVLKSHGIVSNNGVATFLWWKMKLARNGTVR